MAEGAGQLLQVGKQGVAFGPQLQHALQPIVGKQLRKGLLT